MSDCLQPVAFTSHADGAIGPANSILVLMGGESHGRVTQLHTSQLGLLSVGSAPPQGEPERAGSGTEERRWRKRRKWSGRETEGDRYGKSVTEAMH